MPFTEVVRYNKIEEIFTFSKNFPKDIIRLIRIN